MPMAEDLSPFFDVDEFAVTATLADGSGSMPVIYDRASIEAMGAAAGVEATTPVALARSSDVAALQIDIGTALRIPVADQAAWGSQEFWGSTFIVRGLQPDGTGMTLLILEVA